MVFTPDGIAPPGILLLGCSPSHHDEVQNGLWGRLHTRINQRKLKNRDNKGNLSISNYSPIVVGLSRFSGEINLNVIQGEIIFLSGLN